MDVMLVDDEGDFSYLVKLRLERYGFVVHAARSEEEALALYQQKKMPVALIDYHMGYEDNGFELGKKLRSMDDGIVLYLISTSDPLCMEEDTFKVFRGYFNKPLNFNAIHKELLGIFHDR